MIYPIVVYGDPVLRKKAVDIKKDYPNLTYIQFSEESIFSTSFDELRQYLLEEQGGICCYCQKKIKVVKDKMTGKPLMKTEHFTPKKGKNKDTMKQLNYNNLLAACLGNSDSDNKNHCDSSKSDERLIVLPNPAEIRQLNFDAFLKYKVREQEGEVVVIAANFKNQDLKDDIDKRLNLNEQNLRNQRFAVWKGIWRIVKKNDKIDIRQVQEILEKYNYTQTVEPSKRDFKEFCGFITQWYGQHFKNELSRI